MKLWKSCVQSSEPNKKSTANKRTKIVNTMKAQSKCLINTWMISRIKILSYMKKLTAGLSPNNASKITFRKGKNSSNPSSSSKTISTLSQSSINKSKKNTNPLKADTTKLKPSWQCSRPKKQISSPTKRPLLSYCGKA